MKLQKSTTNTFKFISNAKISDFMINCDDHIYNILVGSVRSGKDYSATIAFCLNVLKSDADLHLVAAVDIKNCLRIIGRYILDFLPVISRQCKYNEAPAISINQSGRIKYIVFAGGKNAGSDAGIRGLTLGSVYFTEINLLNLDFIDQAIKRTLTYKDKKRVYATFNPRGIRDPFMLKFVNQWQKEQEQFPERKILNYKTFTLIDNPIFTDEDIRQIKMSYDPESVNYKRDILGQFADPTEGLYRVRDYNILNSALIDVKTYNEYFTICDMGESISSTTFILAALYWNNIDKQREVHILKEYHHLNATLPDTQKLSPVQYAEEYSQFIKDCILYMGNKNPSRILYDGTSQDCRNIEKALRQHNIQQLNAKYVIKLEEEERIRTIQSYLYQGKLRISSNCEHCKQDLADAIHDEKHYQNTGEIRTLSVFNKDGHSDALACVAYAVGECVKKIL